LGRTAEEDREAEGREARVSDRLKGLLATIAFIGLVIGALFLWAMASI
jgi:uncharacterized membrane protein